MTSYDVAVVGQGLAGTALAWHLLWRGLHVCVVDREAAVTSSRIAAGLVTPITGQRLAKTWRLDDLWPAAEAFYARAEADTGGHFFSRRPIVRLFRDRAEAEIYDRRADGEFRNWIAAPDPAANPDWFRAPFGSFAMPAAAHLDTVRYLDTSRDVFRRREAYRCADIDPASDLVVNDSYTSLPRHGVRAARIVFCQGHDGATNPWFGGLRFGGAKGEILTVRVPGLAEDRVVNRGVWLLPLGGDLFRAGATYDHDSLDCVPTPRGREEICSRLRAFLRLPFEVVDHQAAVRPRVGVGRPSLGPSRESDRVWLFNGLGSKGSLLAPYFAGQLVDALTGAGGIDPEVRLSKPKETPQPDAGRLTARSHATVREVLRPGEVAVDATTGNGRDTRFLADAVGPTGTVFAFDVQPDALARTAAALRAAGVANVTFLQRNHAELADAIPDAHRGRVGAVMFNLGYLPGGDKEKTTTAASTLPAIRAALDWLRPGGVMTVVAYAGHPAGADEVDGVAGLLNTLPADSYTLTAMKPLPGRRPRPLFFVVRKSEPGTRDLCR